MSGAEMVGHAATYEDLWAVPDNLVAEIVNGDLWVTPRPIARHSYAAAILSGQLIPPFGEGRGGPGGWWILPECEVHCHGDVLVPDLAGWKRTRLKARTIASEPFIKTAP